MTTSRASAISNLPSTQVVSRLYAVVNLMQASKMMLRDNLHRTAAEQLQTKIEDVTCMINDLIDEENKNICFGDKMEVFKKV